MQLIYRWTKSLDPSLKKGFWAPEEDAVGFGGPRRAVFWDVNLHTSSDHWAHDVPLDGLT